MRTQTRNRFLIAMSPLAGRLLGATLFRPGRPPFAKDMRILGVSRFDERVNGLWERTSPQYRVMVVRNQEYLNWRYVAVPDVDYLTTTAEREGTIAGYLVISRKHVGQAKIGIILDVFAESEGVARCLIADAVARCRQEGLDLLYGARMAGSWLARAFRASGFLPMPFVKAIRVTGRSVSPAIAEELRNPKNWFLQIGDSDET